MNKRVLQGIETKKRLINSARKLFREKGYYGVTVDEIIMDASSSKGSFYTHFNSKEELLLEMVPLIDEMYNDFLGNIEKINSSIDKIFLFTQFVFKTMEEEIGMEFISAIYSAQINDAKKESFLISPERAYYQVLEDFIQKGKERGEIIQDVDPDNMTKMLTSCIRGIIYDWCLSKGEFDLATYGGEIIHMILNQIKQFI